VRVAVGTVREPKLDGVRRAFEGLGRLPWPADPVELVAVAVPSGQADTPIGDDATIAGARARARAALALVPGATLALGLEGGVVRSADSSAAAFLRNWAVAWDGVREGLGAGPSLLLPGPVATAVLAGEDLARVIDRVAGERDVRSRQGTFGVLTCDLLPRTEAFAQAVLLALAPFYNPIWEA
jgi:inosine/xanthosine triphosphatase